MKTMYITMGEVIHGWNIMRCMYSDIMHVIPVCNDMERHKLPLKINIKNKLLFLVLSWLMPLAGQYLLLVLCNVQA